ncbi:uncharacterized protein LOC114180546 [Vigna unguiculata]|uniref:uncharacterized protein LOC114180546 n=1 Tax=Vigna unguiculata TaxID=3917 RepID=UPI001016DF99|nr:uncharacterized protein LOC114180546 [Vigna unguiculata]
MVRGSFKLQVELNPKFIRCSALTISSDFLNLIKERQATDDSLQKVKELLRSDQANEFALGDNGVLRFRGRICVSDDAEAMVEHQRPSGMLQPLVISVWKWDSIAMDFGIHLPRTVRGHDVIWVVVDRLTKSAHFLEVNLKMSMANLAQLYIKEIVLADTAGCFGKQVEDEFCCLSSSNRWAIREGDLVLGELVEDVSIGIARYETLYGRRCKTPLCWYQDGESVLVGLKLLQQTTEKVQLVRDRVTRTTCLGRAIRAKKLSPKFLGPYEILRRIGLVAYEIALPPQLANLCPVFHVSQLRKYVFDPSHVLEAEDMQVREDLSGEVQPVAIVDCQVREQKGRATSLVKVSWDRRTGDSTWELEEDMRKSYPHLFCSLFEFLELWYPLVSYLVALASI